MKNIAVTVGTDSGDIKGSTNRALQAAADYVGALGGGTVIVQEGEYLMYDSLHLRSNTTLIGAGADKTVFKKAGCRKALLKATSGYGEETVKLHSLEGFEPGFGVSVSDDWGKGFLTTVGTIVEILDGETFRLNTSMNADCMVDRNAAAATAFPVISAVGCHHIRIEGIGVDGNIEENDVYLDGCRGAGIYLLKTPDAILRHCAVRHYNGDGISYQNCNDVTVRECICEKNAGFGIHPGSGSLRTVIENCVFSRNGAAGIFFCWRVRDGVAEGCDITGNRGEGISIGHRDVNNRIVNNRISENEKGGILFRREDAAHAAHGTRIENNEIFDNGTGADSFGIKVVGEVCDVVIKGNHIGSRFAPDRGMGIYAEKEEKSNLIEGNLFHHLGQDVVYGAGTAE